MHVDTYVHRYICPYPYLPTYLPTFLITYLPTHLPTYIHTYSTSIHTSIQTARQMRHSSRTSWRSRIDPGWCELGKDRMDFGVQQDQICQVRPLSMLSETFSIVSYSRFQCLGVKILSTLKRVYQTNVNVITSANPSAPYRHVQLTEMQFQQITQDYWPSDACWGHVLTIWTKKIACRLKEQHRLTQNDHLAPPHRPECWGDMDNDKDEAYEAGGLERSTVAGVKAHIYWLAFWPWSAKISWQTPRTVIETYSCTLIFLSQKIKFQTLPSSPWMVPCIFGPTSEESVLLVQRGR